MEGLLNKGEVRKSTWRNRYIFKMFGTMVFHMVKWRGYERSSNMVRL